MNPDRAARLHGAVDRDRDEAFTLLPWLDAGGQRMQPAPDPSRASVAFRGVWAASPLVTGLSPLLENAENRALKPGTQGQRIAVLVREDAFPSRPAVGDLVRREATGLRFKVSRIGHNGFGRLILVLSR